MSNPTVGEVAAWLDAYLRIREIPDEAGAVNGLQVECQAAIGRIVAAVDASQATIDGATEPRTARDGSTMLLVHHGLFWDGNQPVTGRRYRRLRNLLAADTALYSAHIPLDVHPEVGNNIVLARALGLELKGQFASYHGIQVGVWGAAPRGPCPPWLLRGGRRRSRDRPLSDQAHPWRPIDGRPRGDHHGGRGQPDRRSP